ncbi:MAG TPA: ATP-binding protein [Actinomycetota bacterium]|nr:ATP-binding protein [Actinomycetota bacterium]
MLDSLFTDGDQGRARLTARLAAFLFLGSGILLLINVPLPGPSDVNRAGELVVGASAIVVGAVVWRIHWERHDLRWQLLLIAPALALIALGNYFGGSNPPYAYGVFFVVVFMWIGLTFPRWTSVFVSPAALVAYIIPILYLPGNVGYGISTAAITIPVCILVAETLAWSLTRIGRTEAALRRTKQDYRQAFQSTRQYAQAYQRQMEVTERLRSTDRMKDTFLQAVSHDLRSPLTAILGAASTLEQQGRALTDDEREDLLRRIGTSARRLDRLLSDLLDIDRLQRGIISPDRRPTDVGDLIERTIADAGLREQRPVEVRVAGSPLVAEIDPAKVERIVENLVANADKHTPARGLVLVEASAERDGLELRVSDEGPGVPDDLKETVFQPFRRGPDTEFVPGVGLGLSLVARFAELHGGRAWVEDRPGGGATFVVFLPATVTSGESPEEPEPAAVERPAR